jgi:uncharacterized Zn-finger protein
MSAGYQRRMQSFEMQKSDDNAVKNGYRKQMQTNPAYQFEIVTVRTAEVSCDGGGGALGHPRVFLHIKPEEGEITCPYCSKTFRLEKRK